MLRAFGCWRWWVAAALCWLAAHEAGGARPPPVDVSKCCRVGEILETDGGCRAGGSNQWAPLVYAPQRRSYLQPRGIVPSHWTVREARRPPCSSPRLIVSEPTPEFLLFANGSLYLRERHELLPPASFCADTGAALVCDEDSRENGEPPAAPLVRKCCGESYAYSERRGTCVSADSEGSGARLLETLLTEQDEESERKRRPRLASGFPACANGTYALAGGLKGARLLANGTLQLGSASLPSEGYCVEWALERAGAGAGEAVVLACPALLPRDALAGGARDLRFTLYPVGLLVSAAFLAATLAAGFALPSSHHALHWRCQTHYVAALLVGDVLLACTQLASNIEPGACVALAVLMHFLFLSAFFWLNTMCFNIWWTFRDFRPTSMEKSQEWCRLRVYEVYAWGGPFLIACVALVLDQLPEEPGYTFLRPRFGRQNCWFYGDTEILTFFFGPVGVLLCVNLALFISTARQLTCGLWRRDEVKSTTERAALGRVCAKLVVVMGVTWVADVVSWAAGGPQEVWYITDLINALQGVFIFIVVGCQPQVWSAVKRAWCVRRLRGERGSRGAAAAPLHSSSQLPSCGESITHNTLANTSHLQSAVSGSGAHAQQHPPPPPPPLPRETVC